MSLFLLDTNFFIQAYRTNYPIDVAESFWRKVEQLAREGRIISIDKVNAEIIKNEDELATWIGSHLPKSFFQKAESSECLSNYRLLSNWAISRSDHYQQNAIDEFLEAKRADAWLIAFAMTYGHIIVTQEISEPHKKSKIKIPDVCNFFGVGYVDTVGMFRRLGEKF
jgi:hypothetical protein